MGLESERAYAGMILEALPYLASLQRLAAGESLSMLGDPRFSGPYYLPEMIRVPEGTAILGEASFPGEEPVHAVKVAAFSLAQHPVIQAAYHVFVQETGHRQPAGWKRHGPDAAQRNAPVVGVSLRDAEAYCRWLSSHTGYTYRLPSEPEWVLAARGCEQMRRYPWGNQSDARRANHWTGQASRLGAVGLFPEGRGPYGHDDLAGNVWEWCSSLARPYPYNPLDGREDPANDSEPRVMHGGSWRSQPDSLRCSARQQELPGDRFPVVGFRLARNG
jgi:formylglycine-generating enzyme required for sulfatase activity